MAKPHLKLVTPATVKRTVRPDGSPTRELRSREYLTAAEVEDLMAAAKGNRWGHRDATMVLVAYRHGLRAAELVDLRWEQVDFKTATLHVRESRKALLARTLSSGTSCGRCGGSSASRSRSRPSCSPRSGERRSRRRDLPAWSSARAPRPSSGSRHTRTCSGTPAAMRSQTRGTTRGRCKPTLDIGTSSTRCATPNCRRRGSKISGDGKSTDAGRRDRTAGGFPSKRIARCR